MISMFVTEVTDQKPLIAQPHDESTSEFEPLSPAVQPTQGEFRTVTRSLWSQGKEHWT